jgi:hypothetical protein
MSAAAYERELARLMGEGWKPGDPIPESLINASNEGSPGAVGIGGASAIGAPENPMQAETMQPAQAGMENAPGVFESMTDEDSAMYAGMGDLSKQRGAAEAMRDTEDARGQYVNQGRTFVAASPLEHLVVGAKRYKGKKDVKGIGEKQTKGRKSLIDLLRRREDDIDQDTIVDSMVMEIDEDERYV